MALDVIIVGGGIVGLATAHRLLESKPDLKIALFEKENMVSMHQTGNNSGVIHSGLYYKPGSLKAKNCIEGYHQLIDYCQKEDIPFELTGKIVVASFEHERGALENLYQRGIQNGLGGLKKSVDRYGTRWLVSHLFRFPSYFNNFSFIATESWR